MPAGRAGPRRARSGYSQPEPAAAVHDRAAGISIGDAHRGCPSRRGLRCSLSCSLLPPRPRGIGARHGTTTEPPRTARALQPRQVDDDRLPPSFADDGLQAALAARRQVPGLPVLLPSQYVEQLYAREMLADQAGAVGYLLKDRVFNDDQFVDAIRTVAGRRHGDGFRDVVTKLLGRRSRDEPITRLSVRELEVLESDGRGPVERGDRAAAVRH